MTETTRATRRLIFAAEQSMAALREIAATLDDDQAVAVLNIADLLDGAAQNARTVTGHQGDQMLVAAIFRSMAPVERRP